MKLDYPEPPKTASFTPHMPSVSALSWSICEASTGEVLWGKEIDSPREMASLTKMMTCVVVCHMIECGKGCYKDTVVVTAMASSMRGTTASLRARDHLTVLDLLYGMMLPSGNDAAWALAEHFGAILMSEHSRRIRKGEECDSVSMFIKEMNRVAKSLKLKNTKYVNPHGLAAKANRSTVADLGKLASYLLTFKVAYRIVNQESYSCEVINGDSSRVVRWENTNLLLNDSRVYGIKTGNTYTAGPCLCSAFEMKSHRIIVTVLNSKSVNRRWSEVIRLAEWALSQIEAVSLIMTKDQIKAHKLSSLVRGSHNT